MKTLHEKCFVFKRSHTFFKFLKLWKINSVQVTFFILNTKLSSTKILKNDFHDLTSSTKQTCSCYIWRIRFVGQNVSVAPQCFVL